MKTSASPPPSPPLISFSSLPNDIVLNCLARISKAYHPTLSLVSKSFRSILSSRELYETRTLLGKTENCLYICLNLQEKGYNYPRWFELSRNPKHQKLIPIPPLLHHPFSSTVLSTGSEIYIIGGTVRNCRSNKVFFLDCQSHQWYQVYDTETCEPLCATEINPIIKNSLVQEGSGSGSCVVELDDMLYKIYRNTTTLWSCDPVTNTTTLWWCDPVTKTFYSVKGLKGLLPDSNNIVMVNPRAGRRVTLFWKKDISGCEGGHYTKECKSNRCNKEGKTEIWCAEISLERRSKKVLWGSVEWSKCVFTYNRYRPSNYFVLYSTVVTL